MGEAATLDTSPSTATATEWDPGPCHQHSHIRLLSKTLDPPVSKNSKLLLCKGSPLPSWDHVNDCCKSAGDPATAGAANVGEPPRNGPSGIQFVEADPFSRSFKWSTFDDAVISNAFTSARTAPEFLQEEKRLWRLGPIPSRVQPPLYANV